MVTIGPLLLPVMKDFNVPLSRGGLIAMGFFVGRALGALLLNFLLAHIPVKRTLVVAYVVQAAGLAGAGLLSHSLWSFFDFYVLVGLAAAMPMTISGMWVSAHVREGTERAMTLVVSFFALGMVIAPWVVGALMGTGSNWRWILVGEGGLSLLLALVTAGTRLRDIPRRENLRLRQIKEVWGFSPGLLGFIAAAGFLYVGAESTLGVWLPKFEQGLFGSGAMWAGLTVTSFWIGELIGRLGVIPLLKRFRGPYLVLWFGSLFTVLCVVIALSPTQAVSMLIVFVAGLAASAIWPLISGHCSRFPHWHAGVVYSAMVFAGGLGSISFPYAFGPAAHAFGFRTAMALVALPAAFVTLLAAYVPRTAKRA